MLVVNGQAANLILPGERPLDHLAMLLHLRARLEPFVGDPSPDMPLAQDCPTTAVIVPLVGMNLGRAFAPVPVRLEDRPDRIEHLGQYQAVVAVGAGQAEIERRAVPVDHQGDSGNRSNS